MKHICVILLKNEDSSYSFLGTGFLVSNHGIILTAAHLFYGYNDFMNRLICCFPEGYDKTDVPFYGFESLYNEYKYPELQKIPVIRDIGIGKIKIQSKDYLILNRKRPQLNEKLIPKGYINDAEMNPQNKFYLNTKGNINLKHIFKDPIEGTIVIDRFVFNTPPPEEDYNNLKNISLRIKYNNCFTVKYKLHKGASGCPIFDNLGLVVGMYFGGPKDINTYCFFLAAKYIGKQIKRITPYNFDRFQDLEYRLSK